MKNPGIHKFLIGMINLHAHLAFRRYRNTENWLDDLKLVSTGYSFKISVTFLTTQLEKLIKYYERVFGFRLSGLDDFYMPLQPGYDGGCKFMYRIRYSSEG